MNKPRRKEIVKAVDLIEQAKTILEEAESGERDYHGSMPPSIQDGDKGQKSEASADALQEAIDACGAAIEAANTATES